MQKFNLGLIFIVALTLALNFPLNTFAGSRMVLYDNFNSGSIDRDKWDVDDSSASISVKNGRAKFVHDVRKPGDSSWLIFKKNSEKIKEIKVTVWVKKIPDGDPRARIGGWAGEDEDGNLVWSQLQIRPEFERIECFAGALATPSSQDVEYDLFYAHFRRPIKIKDKRFKLEAEFGRRELEYEVSDLGEIEFELEDRLRRTDEIFKGIGTRNNYEGSGKFIVFFDDVYVRYSD